MTGLATSRRIPALLLALAAALPAQDPAAADRNDGARYLPLASGASWTYRFQHRDGQEVVYHDEVVREVEVGDSTCHELRVRRHQTERWEYWAARPDGIYSYPTAYLAGLRGVSQNRKPTRVLACPVGIEPIWEWEERLTFQTSVSDGAVSPVMDDDELLVRYKAEIEAMDDEVTVPAGTYRALRVKTTGVNKNWTTTTLRWFAPGVGLVKETLRGSSWEGAHEKELIAFKPAAPVRRRSVEEILATWRKSRGGEATTPARWIDQPVLRTWFDSRFAMVDGALVRVGDDSVVAFDPAEAAAWNLLLSEEELEFGGSGGAALGQAVNDLTSACALLLAERARPTVDGSAALGRVRIAGPVTVVTQRDGKREGEAWAELRRKKDDVTSYRVSLDFVEGEVTDLQVRERQGAADRPKMRAGAPRPPIRPPGRRR